MKNRLDVRVADLRLAPTRSQAESAIKLGDIKVNGIIITKPGYYVSDNDTIKIIKKERYVSRAGQKLSSVARLLHVNFENAIVLDVGSSTGGFTDYALQHGATKIIAIDVGTDQLHSSLRANPKIELHEKTDIRDVRTSRLTNDMLSESQPQDAVILADAPDVIVIDVSFISLRDILQHIAVLSSAHTQVVAMLKPQFEAGKQQTNKGVIKNDSVRRSILKDFETWVKQFFVIIDKRDSSVHGAKGNQERFYLLKKTS